MMSEMASDPIVVYGAPRSGTTYLQEVLNVHPDVFVSHETRIFAWLYHAVDVLPRDDRLVANDREQFMEYLRRVSPRLIRDFYRELAPGVYRWGDKNPHYADPFNDGCLELVAGLFPGSVFVHIIRDGRDVVSSLIRKEDGGTPWVTFDAAHFTWARHVDRGAAFGEALNPSRYFQLRYEDLVNDDVHMASEVLRFLGLELHPDVEVFCRGQQEQRTPFKGPTRNLEKGVTTSDWATILTPEQQARSLRLIGSHLVKYGYETEDSLAQLRERTAQALSK
jgi:hypothetical protein